MDCYYSFARLCSLCFWYVKCENKAEAKIITIACGIVRLAILLLVQQHNFIIEKPPQQKQ